MAARPSWKGFLKLSLVSCPVHLYPATTSTEKISFNLLHKDTLNRVKMVPTDPDLGPVDRADLVKGFQVDKDRYIVVEDDEIAALQVESSKTIDVEGFVDPESIGPLWLDAPYYVAPDGSMAAEAFAVIREAMAQSGKTGLARVTIGSRERLCAMTPCEGGLILFTLREAKEVRQPSEVFGDLEESGPAPSGEMLDLALEIVRRKSVEFDPTTYEDRYQKALRELVQAKLRGAAPVTSKPQPEPGKVINIMDALRRSLEQSKGARAANDDAPKPAPKKARGKKSDARQRSMLLPLAGGSKGDKAAAGKPSKPAPAAKRKRA